MENKILYLMLLLIAGGSAATEKAYKSIDDSGQVTYSPSPPEGAVKSKPVTIQPGPTDDQKRQAEERVESAEEKAEALRREREEAQKQREDAAPPRRQTVEQVEVVGTPVDRRLPNWPAKLPNENPTGEDHPVYQPGFYPGNPPSVLPLPRPTPHPLGQ